MEPTLNEYCCAAIGTPIDNAATAHLPRIFCEGYRSRELFADEYHENTLAGIMAWVALDNICAWHGEITKAK